MTEAAAPKATPRKPDPGSMTFLEHLDELRTRILSCLKVLGVTLAICGWFWQPITQFFLAFVPDSAQYIVTDENGVERSISKEEYARQRAAHNPRAVQRSESRIIAIQPAETFMAAVKSVIVVTLIITSPWLLLQIWFFVAPGLYAKEKRYVIPFIGAGTLFFALGLLFAYYVGIPLSTRVLYNTDIGGTVHVQWTVKDTLSFVLRMFVAFGVTFEMPVVVFVLAALGIVSPKTLSRQRPYVVVGIFFVAAVLTPPDYVSQLILAAPLWLLFEVSIIAAHIFVSRHKVQEVTVDPYDGN